VDFSLQQGASRAEDDLSSRQGLPLSVSNAPAFPIHSTTAFPTYGLGARAPLMFKGTLSGHNDVFLSEPMAFFYENPESTLPRVDPNQVGTEWMGEESQDFSILNPEM